MDEQREWLKVPEVAEVLRIAHSRAYELVADGGSQPSRSAAACG